MRTRRQNPFTTVRTEGALLPVDLLQRIAEGDPALEGLTPEAYHLSGEKINEAASRAWSRLRGAWASFRAAADKLPAGDLGTSITRERWLLPLFDTLSYGRLETTRALEIEGKSYPVSHLWQGRVPIHLVSFKVDLDTRTAGVAGAARVSPHGMVQELLNRSDDHLWAFVSNGLRLRILRDNVRLTRPAYVEFDLEAMMEGEVYSDFVLLWLLCHQSRVEATPPSDCWLERWMRAAEEQGTRALENLRDGVEEAINALGRGILAHPANRALKDQLRSGELDTQEYYRQLLRMVYRLLFLFVAEDRDLLLDPDADPEARRRYTEYYATAKLRRLAARRVGTRHADLMHGLRLVMRKLGEDGGCPELGLPALGSFLFSPEAVEAIGDCEIANHDLLDAVRALAFTHDAHALRPVDFRNLGSRELGSVYESLLELHPVVNVDAGTFRLESASGNERKTTGSYYTPESLIQSLLDSALDPVLDEAAAADDPEKAILDLKVCDPACGSGHFLIAAAHRIAQRLAAVRSQDAEPSPEVLRHALRDVIGHCIYGVDLNPMAVELCKVSLWMEALEPGRPLSFLEHRIQCGNSLLGTTPALLRAGIPDDAFKPIEGDDKAVCSELRRRNRRERESEQHEMFTAELQPWERLGEVATAIVDLDELPDDTIEGVRAKQRRYEETVRSAGYRYGRLLADAWCAAFVWRKTEDAPAPPITEEVFRRIERNPFNIYNNALEQEIRRLADQYKFFHWHLAFPDVFRPAQRPEVQGNDPTGWEGGFDVVLGNPPWERTAFEDAQFFATRAPEILEAATTAARKRRIEALKDVRPTLYAAYYEARRQADAETHLIKAGGRYRLGASGRINTYALFTNLTLHLIDQVTGRSGTIVQTGIATDAPMEAFWKALVEEGRIVSVYDFENRQGIFPGVHRSFKFCLLTLRAPTQDRAEEVRCGFFLQRIEDVGDPNSTYKLRIADLEAINPNTKQPPVCRSQRDLRILRDVHLRHPVLNRSDDPQPRARAWVAFTSSGYSEHYLSRDQLPQDGGWKRNWIYESGDRRYIPLIEAKQIHQFDPCFATYDDVSSDDLKQGNPRTTLAGEHVGQLPTPRFWAPEDVIADFYRKKSIATPWVAAIRDVTNVTNERTSIACVLPKVGMIQPLNGITTPDALEALRIVGALNSIPLDFIARQKVPGTHLNVTIFSQLPVPERTGSELETIVLRNAFELSYTVEGMEAWAALLGYDGPPFRWDEERRFLLRCELDAAFFHLYGIDREDVDYIMETFPIVKRKDVEAYGEYRTKRVILEIYDEMTDAMRTGTPYRTRLDPPPADPRVAHPSS